MSFEELLHKYSLNNLQGTYVNQKTFNKTVLSLSIITVQNHFSGLSAETAIICGFYVLARVILHSK